MTSKIKPIVKVNLDKPRSLIFDLNAMASFQEATGKNMFAGGIDNMGPLELRALLWSCLVHEDEALTIKQVGAMLTTDNMQDVTTAIGKAFSLAMPEPKESETPLAQKPPTG